MQRDLANKQRVLAHQVVCLTTEKYRIEMNLRHSQLLPF